MNLSGAEVTADAHGEAHLEVRDPPKLNAAFFNPILDSPPPVL